MARLIERRRDVCGGQPVIAGTRIRTEIIWCLATSGCDLDATLLHYSILTQEQVEAALAYERRWYRRIRRAVIGARSGLVRWAWERSGDE